MSHASPSLRVHRSVLAVAVAALVFVGCHPSSHDAGSHWGYSGSHGPENWGTAGGENCLCAEGTEQSPIDIRAADLTSATLESLSFDYSGSTVVEVFNNGHTIQADVAPGGGVLRIGDDAYRLLQFHFHTPSEHRVEGESFAAEMHLVHVSETGTLAVVGILMRAGAPMEGLARVWADLPDSIEAPARRLAEFDLRPLVPENKRSYRYAGSLTTPPCSEGVRWHVMAQSDTMSAWQLDAFTAMFGPPVPAIGNSRPVQPLHGRVIRTDVD